MGISRKRIRTPLLRISDIQGVGALNKNISGYPGGSEKICGYPGDVTQKRISSTGGYGFFLKKAQYILEKLENTNTHLFI